MTPEMEVAYRNFETELFKRELSNSEAYDKAVLANASGGLGLSLAFIKDVVPFATATHIWSLKLSWLLLTAAIFAVMASFQLSQRGLSWERARTLRVCEAKDGEEVESAESEVNRWNQATVWTNRAAGALFVLGVIVTMAFVWINVHPPESPVAHSAETGRAQEVPMTDSRRGTTTRGIPTGDAASAPTFQRPSPKPTAPAPTPPPKPAPKGQ